MALDIGLYPKQLVALSTYANEVLYGGAVGGGKALDVQTPMLTVDSGWKTMGTLVVGDRVFDEQGMPCNVVAKSKVDKKSSSYCVSFGEKLSIICDGRHEWATLTRADRCSRRDIPTPKTTLEIKGTLHAEKGKRRNHSIPLTKSLQFEEKELPIHPYILGAYLGGGMIDEDRRLGMKLTSWCNSSKYLLKTLDNGKYFDKKSWYSLLESVGLNIPNENLYIPDAYKFSSEEQRLELVQGILDVKGTVYSDNCNYKRSAGQVELFTNGRQLGEDVNYMLLSLGQRSLFYKREKSGREHANWRVRCYANRIVFKSKDKSMKQERSMSTARTAKQNLYIQGVKKVKHIPMQCIQVDSPNHCYLAGKDLIPTHNSYLMRVASILWAMECPGIQIYLFRLTRKELNDNHMVGEGGFYDLLGDAVNSRYVKINNSDHVITFRNGHNNSFMNGSMIHLCHCQHENDKYNYRGAEMGVLMIDEATLFSSTKYTYLRTRVRISKGWSPPKAFTDIHGTDFFPRILLGSNPGGVSHNFFKKEFVKLADPLTITQMSKKRGGMRRQYIPARLDDNPSIDKDEYEGRVMGVGNDAIARMLLDGDWDAVAGGMFDDIWDEDIHMIEPFKIPYTWYVDRTFDWGNADPFSVGWWAQSDGSEVKLDDGTTVVYPKGTLFRIAEWYGCVEDEENVGIGLTGYEIGHGIKEMENNNPVFKNTERVYGGPSDKQIWNQNPKQDSSFTSTAQEINAGYFGNDSYKLFDIFTKADQSPGSRIRGWSTLRAYLKNSEKFPKIDRECIFFFKTCPTITRIIPSLVRHEKKPDDIADGQEDHVMDEIRYRVQHAVHKSKRINTVMG